MKKFGWTVWGLIGLIFSPIGLIFLITGLAISTTYSFRSLNDESRKSPFEPAWRDGR